MPPITPDEVVELKTTAILEVVFEVFNTLIAQGWDGRSACVFQDDVMAALKAHGVNRHEAYANKWIDVEPSYRDAGWKVVYDKPGYNETYRAFFIFSREGKQQ